MSMINLDLVTTNKPRFPRIRRAVASLDETAKTFWANMRSRSRYGMYPQGSSFEARRHVFAKASAEARKDLGL